MSSTLPASHLLSRFRRLVTKRRQEDGIILIEILMVICIGGILAALAVNTVFNVGPKNDKDQEVRTATCGVVKVVQKWEKSEQPLSTLTEVNPALFANVVVMAADIKVVVAPKLEPTKAGHIIGDYTVSGWSENGTYTEESPLKFDSSEGKANPCPS